MKARPFKKRNGLPIPPEGYYLLMEGFVKEGDQICQPKSPYTIYRCWHRCFPRVWLIKNGIILDHNGVPFSPYWYAARKIAT